ncbi:MAG: hypothetical protein HOY69_36935 [Streptomyces sp.]|nr:hypothetical protein [Streptomyces sp.]
MPPATVQQRADRYRRFGHAGMGDRSSRPQTRPRRSATRTERRIITVLRRWAPARRAHLLHLTPSTVQPRADPPRSGAPGASGPGSRPCRADERKQTAAECILTGA